MKDLQTLKLVIQAANPEIMELKFGCEIQYETFPVRQIKMGVVIYGVGNKEICVMQNRLMPDFISEKRDIRKVIGRPIRLADCIYVAIFKIPMTNAEWKKFLSKTIAFWNLLDDNLDHQSPECIDFLINLLT